MPVSYGQSGYVGSSMSCRAQDSYNQGAMPKSKWTKEEIIKAVLAADSQNKWTRENLSKFPKNVLFSCFIVDCGWHHTSKFANETDFYCVDDRKVEMVTREQLKAAAARERESKNEPKPKIRKGKIEWEEWCGSKRYGRYEKCTSFCLFVGDWAYCENGKKNIYGNHILKTEFYDRAPKGTAEIFAQLKRNLPSKFA